MVNSQVQEPGSEDSTVERGDFEDESAQGDEQERRDNAYQDRSEE